MEKQKGALRVAGNILLQTAIDEKLASIQSEKRQPGSINDPDSDAATHQRMADVYAQTAVDVDKINKQHRRNMLRAANPRYQNISDEEADRILAMPQNDWVED